MKRTRKTTVRCLAQESGWDHSFLKTFRSAGAAETWAKRTVRTHGDPTRCCVVYGKGRKQRCFGRLVRVKRSWVN